jgi:hypothetical protein
METVYQMVSRTDEETMRFLDDVILLAVHANPDGMELVSNWYMRNPEPTQRSSSGIPRLYQKYVGHDNNRDFYMVAQPETENMSRVLFREWFPQIVYNHHQSGPAGTVLFAPPFRDPYNYNFDPLVPLGIEAVGAAMHGRFVAEGKPGSTMRSGASYSTWWNGGLRTVTYFHNQIGLLTEIIGNPTPQRIPFVPRRQLASNDLPAPIEPQEWHFRQSIDYSITANRGVLDYASRYRDVLLYNLYQMGRNSIERGGGDNWTIHPKKIQMVEAAARMEAGAQPQQAPTFGRRGGVNPELFDLLRTPESRDPRGYIIPSDQPDFLTATKFVNALIKSGVTIHRATRDFEVAGKTYPENSYVVNTAQAFRPHVIDMFEPQDHPNDFQYPGGPPIPPYDNAGWTLAYLMGVEFDRILDGFDGPFQRIEGFAEPPAGRLANARGAAGFLLSHKANDAFIAMNRLFADNKEVYWLSDSATVGGTTWPAGTMYIPNQSGTQRLLQQIASELGLNFVGVQTPPVEDALRIRPVRIGLWDRYGGSMPSGWTRWLFEQFEFPFDIVYPETLDRGNLKSQFDVLVFVTGAIPQPPSAATQGGFGGGFGGSGPDRASIPAEFRGWLGSVTLDRTVPQLNQFLEDGGTIVTIGSSTAMAYHAGVPVENYLLDYNGQPLSRDDYYMPGSVHRVRVDNTLPVAWGMGEYADVFFNNSPVFKLDANAESAKRIAWFDSNEPLRSGWAWGQQFLSAGTAMIEADVGEGKLYLFGPEVLNRGQPHGTFKLFFNGIFLAGAEEVAVRAASDGGS